MFYRRKCSGVAYLTICIFLLLGITLTRGFLSGTNATSKNDSPSPSTAQSMLEVQSTPTAQSEPMNQTVFTNQPVPTNLSTPTAVLTLTTSTVDLTLAIKSRLAKQRVPDMSMESTFVVVPQNVVVNVGDTFLVSVFAENVTNMYGWQINLCFDPAVVECLNVSLPDQRVFSDEYPVSQALIDFNNAEFTTRPLQSIQNDEGYVLAGDCLLGQNQTTFYGSGFLCQVAFRAVSPGSSNLTLSTSKEPLATFYLDDNIETTIPSVFNSLVTVQPE